MNKRDDIHRSGFALSEILIAVAIAAGVFAAVATSLGTSSRLSVRTEKYTQILTETRIITARLKAGMTHNDALKGFTGWSITSHSFEHPLGDGREMPFEIARLQRTGRPPFEFETLIRKIRDET